MTIAKLADVGGDMPRLFVLGALLAIGILGGLVAARLRPARTEDAARTVDDHHQLKDRAGTALDFSRIVTAEVDDKAFHRLQIADADEHLRRIDPRAAAPIPWPRRLLIAGGVAILAVVITLWPAVNTTVQADVAAPLPEVLEQVEILREEIAELEEAAQDAKTDVENDEESAREAEKLESLVEALEEKLTELEQPGVDLKEALAKLSEMQAAIATEHAKFDVSQFDAAARKFGKALQAAEALEEAGKALERSDFDRAAKQLDKFDPRRIKPRDARNVREALKQAANSSTRESELDRLAERLAEELGEFAETLEEAGLSEGDTLDALGLELTDADLAQVAGKAGESQEAIGELAKKLGKLARQAKLGKKLGAKLAALGACKDSMCQGSGASPKNSMQKGRGRRSSTPSDKWGRKTAGNINDDPTKIDGDRDLARVTGTPGAGPSEIETTVSPDGRQDARRGFREKYAKYKKMSDAVIESEALPLGQRATIQRYFELIRPTATEAAAIDEATESGSGKKTGKKK